MARPRGFAGWFDAIIVPSGSVQLRWHRALPMWGVIDGGVLRGARGCFEVKSRVVVKMVVSVFYNELGGVNTRSFFYYLECWRLFYWKQCSSFVFAFVLSIFYNELGGFNTRSFFYYLEQGGKRLGDETSASKQKSVMQFTGIELGARSKFTIQRRIRIQNPNKLLIVSEKRQLWVIFSLSFPP